MRRHSQCYSLRRHGRVSGRGHNEGGFVLKLACQVRFHGHRFADDAHGAGITDECLNQLSRGEGRREVAPIETVASDIHPRAYRVQVRGFMSFTAIRRGARGPSCRGGSRPAGASRVTSARVVPGADAEGGSEGESVVARRACSPAAPFLAGDRVAARHGALDACTTVHSGGVWVPSTAGVNRRPTGGVTARASHGSRSGGDQARRSTVPGFFATQGACSHGGRGEVRTKIPLIPEPRGPVWSPAAHRDEGRCGGRGAHSRPGAQPGRGKTYHTRPSRNILCRTRAGDNPAGRVSRDIPGPVGGIPAVFVGRGQGDRRPGEVDRAHARGEEGGRGRGVATTGFLGVSSGRRVGINPGVRRLPHRRGEEGGGDVPTPMYNNICRERG